ncbi:MAG: 6-bladed beta-propeller [bacterium]|nr:6-bladed beta-propeller [bacterium]
MLFLAAAPVIACKQSPEADVSPPITVFDSAGVQVVDNHRPVFDSAQFWWSVDPEPVLVIGGHHRTSAGAGDSDPLIWNVKGAGRLADGRVVILSHGSDHKVMIFEASGRLATSFGRKGRGPGEFSSPQHLQVLPGDTIVVWDDMFGPVSYFDPSGKLLEYRRIDLGAVYSVIEAPDQIPGEAVRLPLPDGSFVLNTYRRGWTGPPKGYFRPPLAFLRIDSVYNTVSFGWWEGLEQFSLRSTGAALGYLPFRAESISTAGGDPLSVYITNGNRYEIHQFSAIGLLQRVIRRRVEAIPITARQVAEWKRDLTKVVPMMDWNIWDRERAQLERRFHPPISGMLVDSQGYLWVRSPTAVWSVFDQEGRWLGEPAYATGDILWIGDDVVIRTNSHRDTGVESVEAYRLDRRDPRTIATRPLGVGLVHDQ